VALVVVRSNRPARPGFIGKARLGCDRAPGFGLFPSVDRQDDSVGRGIDVEADDVLEFSRRTSGPSTVFERTDAVRREVGGPRGMRLQPNPPGSRARPPSPASGQVQWGRFSPGGGPSNQIDNPLPRCSGASAACRAWPSSSCRAATPSTHLRSMNRAGLPIAIPPARFLPEPAHDFRWCHSPFGRWRG